MAKGYMKEIRSRILAFPEGEIFTASDFIDLASESSIRQGLERLRRAGQIRRILRGIYEKPRFSSLLGEYVECDPQGLAKALARCYHWTIAPCGNTSLNLLGLSSQVTSVWSYVSDGPYKSYELNSTKLEFKHRSNKDISLLSYSTRVVVSALKALGKEHLTSEIIETLSKRLSKEEKRLCLKEAKESTRWVYGAIKQICGG